MMKLGSLFDGIGGFPLAATLHNIEPVWASEIENFPIEVTKTRFPDMKHLGDITQINGVEIEPVDIITFGSPCQDLSVAGKRDGIEGKRSNLFYQAVRIIREMRRATDGRYPRFALWENVPGAFSSNRGADFRSVLEEITESKIPMPHTGRWATAGMVRGRKCEVAWRVFDAQHWGVPQRRRRIFLVVDFAGQRAGEILFESESVSGDSQESREAREEVAAGAGNGTGISGNGTGVDTYNLMFTGDKAAPLATNIRTANTGANGHGVAREKAHTLDQAQGQAVAQLYENHGQDSRLTGPLEVAPTVAKKYGTGGNNVPLVHEGYPDPAHAVHTQPGQTHRDDMDTFVRHQMS